MRRFHHLAEIRDGRRLITGAILLAPGQAAIDIVLLLALHRSTGSFAAGGLAVAVFTIANSAANLLQSRLIDRAGSPRLLGVCALATLAAVGGLCGALSGGAPAGGLLALVAVVGVVLPASAPALRTLLAARLPDPDERATGFAFVTLTQEFGFIAGPAAFAALAALVSPQVALLACAASLSVGTLIVAALPGRLPTRDPDPGADPGADPGTSLGPLVPLASVMVFLGGALGALDVSGAAFAVQRGAPSLSGLMLAAASVGGILGGLFYGGRMWRAPPTARLGWCGLVTAGMLVLPALAPDLPTLAPALALAGAPLSATLTTAYLCADGLVPAARRTEAFALLGLALNAGVALGNAGAGALAGALSAHAGFLLSSGCALACAVGALLARLSSVR